MKLEPPGQIQRSQWHRPSHRRSESVAVHRFLRLSYQAIFDGVHLLPWLENCSFQSSLKLPSAKPEYRTETYEEQDEMSHYNSCVVCASLPTHFRRTNLKGQKVKFA